MTLKRLHANCDQVWDDQHAHVFVSVCASRDSSRFRFLLRISRLRPSWWSRVGRLPRFSWRCCVSCSPPCRRASSSPWPTPSVPSSTRRLRLQSRSRRGEWPSTTQAPLNATTRSRVGYQLDQRRHVPPTEHSECSEGTTNNPRTNKNIITPPTFPFSKLKWTYSIQIYCIIICCSSIKVFLATQLCCFLRFFALLPCRNIQLFCYCFIVF